MRIRGQWRRSKPPIF